MQVEIDPQIELAKEFGLIYRHLYIVSFKDPDYPCSNEIHTKMSIIEDGDPCCWDLSYKDNILEYCGVFSDPKKGNYFFFEENHPGRKYLTGRKPFRRVFHSQLKDHTIIIHRGTYDSKLKKRHSPKDFPIDCLKHYEEWGKSGV